MTSYQQRKKEIRELKKVVSELENKLKENGIQFGQLSIDAIQKMGNAGIHAEKAGHLLSRELAGSKPQPPAPPLGRKIRQGVGVFCDICHSTMSRRGYLGLFGQRKCDNKECKNSK